MICPHCDKEIPGVHCPECKAMSPESANYCMECGFSLERKVGDILEGDDTMEDENGFDLETRILCPDGTCTGILAMGRCTECGKAFPHEDNGNNI